MAVRVLFGLGNPGLRYRGTRHNLGFEVLEALAEKLGFSWKFDKKVDAEVATGVYLDRKIALVKPQTFMNLSGISVQSYLDYYQISIDEILVIFDDFNLEIGQSKLKIGGGDGGHNGISNIILHNSADFTRFRVGIKPKCMASISLSDFVLARFDLTEGQILKQLMPIWLDQIELMLDKGIEKAMNQTNKKNLIQHEQDRE
jgi:PTH1 family peptidyl-tRNA hydrolase